FQIKVQNEIQNKCRMLINSRGQQESTLCKRVWSGLQRRFFIYIVCAEGEIVALRLNGVLSTVIWRSLPFCSTVEVILVDGTNWLLSRLLAWPLVMLGLMQWIGDALGADRIRYGEKCWHNQDSAQTVKGAKTEENK